MSQEAGDGPDVTGLSVEEAVDAVLAEDDSRDRESVRAALETVAEDGVVSDASVDSALGELAKVVSTPETRVEFAAMELSEAKETAEAEGVADLDTVRARVEAYESRLESVEEEIGELGPGLRAVVDRHGAGANAYEVATGIREVETEADDLHYAADELQVEVEEFGRWLTDPGTRHDEFEEQLEAVEASLDGLSGTVEDLAAVEGEGDAAGEDATGGDDEGGAAVSDLPADPGVVWADARLRTRVTALLLADLRAELADLRAWPDGAGSEGDRARLEEFDDRLEALEERCQGLRERLDGLARPAWTERFGDRLDEFEAAMDGFEPPVSWGEVEAELERHQDVIEPTD
jgi:division protein CdvB (Snf7/Vps24/ESCRT-III family)